ncbi:MAG: hypothetical protein SFW62_02015 [Alphaproteobacteria bacterium]|nr:hypothetical protein [Alphaproteobacteria bacterium]
MILGMPVAHFTLLHTAISLIAIVAGIVMLAGMVRGRFCARTHGVFLLTTIATSATGFMFPLAQFGPPRIFGLISFAALAAALFALYVERLKGRWRVIYIGTVWLTFYLNVVVLVVQSFQKIPALNVFAPTQKEPPFLATQSAVLLLFVICGVLALRRFRPPAGKLLPLR